MGPHHDMGRRRRRRSDAATVIDEQTGHGTVLGLQRAAGNRAVTRLLSLSVSAPSLGSVVQRKGWIAMKDAASARRTSGSASELRAWVNGVISSGNLQDMEDTESQLRTSITNREQGQFTKGVATATGHESHAARIELEKQLVKKLRAEIARLKPAKTIPKKEPAKTTKSSAATNPFDLLGDES